MLWRTNSRAHCPVLPAMPPSDRACQCSISLSTDMCKAQFRDNVGISGEQTTSLCLVAVRDFERLMAR